MHFTRVEHVADIVEHGLMSDNRAQAEGRLAVEVGNVGIKQRRRARQVHLAPGGAVADYVPFYFAPRSPMMNAIHWGNVPTYTEGCQRLVYLTTTLERLADSGLTVIVTDRNAVLAVANFEYFTDELDEDFIDWDLMTAVWWNNTPEWPDRRERRMAECLVRPSVPWEAIESVVAHSRAVADEVDAALTEAGVATPVYVRPEWYF